MVPTYALWDEKSAYAILARQLDAVRDAGALARLPLDLATFDLLAVRCGDFASAEEAITEADALSKATGAAIVSASAMRLAAFRGREEARALIDPRGQEASAAGQGVIIELTEWLLALLYNGVGRYREAVAAAKGRRRRPPGGGVCLGLDRDRTARSCNQERQSGGRRASLSSASLRRRPSLAPTRHRESSLAPVHSLSDGATAEGLYREAIERLGRSLSAPRARPSPPPLWRMVAPGGSSRGRARTTPDRLRPALLDRHGSVRRARPGRAAGHRREGPQADCRDASMI